LFEYNQYRNQQRAVCKGITAMAETTATNPDPAEATQKGNPRIGTTVARQKDIAVGGCSRVRHRATNAQNVHTQDTPSAVSENLRTWVAERAVEGDARAAAQLRGWRYADQRNQRRLDTSLEANALHLSPAAPDEEKTAWSEFMQQRLAAQQRAENLAGQIATARIWTINRTTGMSRTRLMESCPSSTVGGASLCSIRTRPQSSLAGDGCSEIRIAHRVLWRRRLEAAGGQGIRPERHLR